jgi:cyclopropane fatty-acyl-phospholipid synthase-like methyltransferase
MYQTPPAWDIGRPQPALLSLASSGALAGRVLDIGCGTGEHVLMAALHGLDATGVDVSAEAVRRATRKAAERGVTQVRFVVGDVLQPATVQSLDGPFDTIIDCGVFHVFSDDERTRYVTSVRALLRDGGRYVMLVFSDEEPPGWGPRRITQDEIRAALVRGWRIESIDSAHMQTRMQPAQPRCWLTIATAI